jgi:hypothetical protein
VDDALEPFPRELLANPEFIEKRHGIFERICKFCHGKSACPCKAPKLNPSRYTPEFVYDRVPKGFPGMPAWNQQFSEEKHRAVTVCIKRAGNSRTEDGGRNRRRSGNVSTGTEEMVVNTALQPACRS